ncbi:MAG: hypothetical protein ACRDG3_01085, partial [Tepidiformaceae bacterium]
GVLTVPFADGTSLFVLGEAGDALHLFSPDGTEVDAISFGDDRSIFDPSPLAPGQGESLGLLDPQADHDGSDWVLTDHPTPGESNAFADLPANPHGQPAAIAGRSAVAARERSSSPSATVVWVALGTLLAAGLGGVAAYSQRRKLDAFAQKVRRGR